MTDLEGRVHDRRLVEHRATVKIYFDLEQTAPSTVLGIQGACAAPSIRRWRCPLALESLSFASPPKGPDP